jgi:hypothetical protein
MKSLNLSSVSRVLVLVVAAVVLAIVPLGVAQSAPVLNGNIDDVLGFVQTVAAQGGCSAEKADLYQDIRIFDPEFIPCVPVVDNYFPYELDLVRNAFAYDAATGTLYLGLRSAGIIGDADGNGDPDIRCPQSNIEEGVGIGSGERFRWRLRGLSGVEGDVNVTVEFNQVAIAGATGLAAEFAFAGNDLEVALHGVTIGPKLEVFLTAGSLTDMFAEDASQLTWAARRGEPLVTDPGIVRPIIRNGAETPSIGATGVARTTLGELKAQYRR